MAKALFDISAILVALKNEAIVLTPNRRLSNQIRLAIVESQTQATKASSILSPRVFNFSEWTESLWQQLAGTDESFDKLIINDIQRQHIWSEIIKKDNMSVTGAAASNLAKQASEAYQRLQLWELPITVLESAFDDEKSNNAKLINWMQQFEKRLDKIQSITREDANKLILDAFESEKLSKESEIYLQSFDVIPPLYEKLIHLASGKVSVSDPLQNNSNSPYRSAALDKKHEVRAAATWSRKILAEQPDAKIGIVTPNLGSHRDLIERVFCETFEPQYYAIETPRYTLPFNISTGTPLGKTPLINDTLLLLRLNQHKITHEQCYQILGSPFFSSIEDETRVRGDLVRRLKKKKQFTFRTAEIRSAAEKTSGPVQDGENTTGTNSHTNLSRCLLDFEEFRRRNNKPCSIEVWVQRFFAQLEYLQWPGPRKLDSVEFQQVTQWHQLLEKLLSLDLVQKTWSFSEAFSALEQLANATHFQAEVKDSPIQILGLLEGVGLSFSHCWVLGLDSQTWPQKLNPNPLLPLALQRDHKMPQSSLENELIYAQSLTNNYLHCADHVVMSYSNDDQEAALLPSPLIDKLEKKPLSDFSSFNDYGLDKHRADLSLAEFELVDCSVGPKYQKQNDDSISDGSIKGGFSILKQQAQCPFNAFAKYRLGTEQSEAPSLGLSAADKGNIVHGVLALIWQDLKDQKNLNASSDQKLTDLISDAVTSVFTKKYFDDSEFLDQHYYDLERKRFERLAWEWLSLEKNRVDFSVVEIEKELKVNFGGLPLTLRIDRIDQLANDENLLIDYKTGSVTRATWAGERPDEPQLPLYAVALDEQEQDKVKGIAFATIKTKECDFFGIAETSSENSDKKLSLPGKAGFSENWEKTLEEFRRVLLNLSEEFANGSCAVDFKKYQFNSFDTELDALNRITEIDFINEWAQNKS